VARSPERAAQFHSRPRLQSGIVLPWYWARAHDEQAQWIRVRSTYATVRGEGQRVPVVAAAPDLTVDWHPNAAQLYYVTQLAVFAWLVRQLRAQSLGARAGQRW
jgi:hypothetical protein